MGRVCADSGRYLPQTSYSSNQWWKGLGLSRYATCSWPLLGHFFHSTIRQRAGSTPNLIQLEPAVEGFGPLEIRHLFMAIARTLLPLNNPTTGRIYPKPYTARTSGGRVWASRDTPPVHGHCSDTSSTQQSDNGQDLPQTLYSSNQWWKGLGLSRYATYIHGHCSDTSSTQRSDSGRYNNSENTSYYQDALDYSFASGTFRWVAKGVYTDAHGLASPAFGNGSRRVLFSKRNTLFWTSRQSTGLWSLSTASTSRKSIHALPLSHAGACLTVESEYAMLRLWCCDFRTPQECLHSLKWTWSWTQGKRGTTELTA
jgi:hypothetical protein